MEPQRSICLANVWKSQGAASWAGGGGRIGAAHTSVASTRVNTQDPGTCSQSPSLRPTVLLYTSHMSPPTCHPVLSLMRTAGFALKPLPQSDGNYRLTRPTARRPHKGGTGRESPKVPKEGKTLVKTEMSEGDRDEVTVLVAPKQDQGTVGLGGGRLAVPSVPAEATLMALASSGCSAGSSNPSFS